MSSGTTTSSGPKQCQPVGEAIVDRRPSGCRVMCEATWLAEPLGDDGGPGVGTGARLTRIAGGLSGMGGRRIAWRAEREQVAGHDCIASRRPGYRRFGWRADMKGMLEESPLCAHPRRSAQLGRFSKADITSGVCFDHNGHELPDIPEPPPRYGSARRWRTPIGANLAQGMVRGGRAGANRAVSIMLASRTTSPASQLDQTESRNASWPSIVR